MTQPTPSHNSLLKETREAKGLTLDIVHEATKIPMDVLKAIEQGYSVKILTPFYYRGFLKIYAEFLELDPKDILEESKLAAKSQVVINPPKVIKQRVVSKAKPSKAEAPDVFVGVLSVKNRKFFLKFIIALIVLFGLFKITGCIVHQIKSRPKSSPNVSAKPELVISKNSTKILKAQSNGPGVSLAVRASKDGWIQVKSDGKVVFAMTMKKGTMESWEGKDTIELSGKSINELDFEVNTKHIGSLGSRERKATKVLITKEGLTVKK